MMPFYMQCIACFLATLSFGIFLRQPKKTLLIGSLIGTFDFIIFYLMKQTTIAYFVATLISAIICEFTARIRKTTTTMFLTSAIIPLVPGLGLYRTMHYISLHDYEMAGSVGVDTVMGICAIALAITISTLVFNNIKHKR